MTDYLRPDVYVERVSSSERPVTKVSTSTAGFVGITRRGEVGSPLLITSWSEFIEKVALGLDTPFLENSDLPHAVYGFFQNGGNIAYISRVASSSKAKATVLIPETTGVTFTAVDEGIWANTSLSVVVTDGTVTDMFTVTVKMGGVEVEKFENVSNTATDINAYNDKINGVSKFITIETGETLVAGTGIMSGGVDGVSDLDDVDYTDAMAVLNAAQINLLAVPGQTATTMLNAIATYCETRGDCFAILDAPMNKTASEMVTLRESITDNDYGAIYYPWIKVVDPLSSVGKLRLLPPSGHVVGMIARVDTNRGVHKAPAGEESTLLGTVELETYVTTTNMNLLNPLGINSIISKPNIGIVVWGARTLSADPTRRYISDVRFDSFIEETADRTTGWTVFEPNDEVLWKRMKESLESFLFTMWLDGKLKGANKSEAFYVKCDAELNTQSSIDQGKVIAEIAYASKRPAEFVIIKIVQKSV